MRDTGGDAAASRTAARIIPACVCNRPYGRCRCNSTSITATATTTTSNYNNYTLSNTSSDHHRSSAPAVVRFQAPVAASTTAAGASLRTSVVAYAAEVDDNDEAIVPRTRRSRAIVDYMPTAGVDRADSDLNSDNDDDNDEEGASQRSLDWDCPITVITGGSSTLGSSTPNSTEGSDSSDVGHRASVLRWGGGGASPRRHNDTAADGWSTTHRPDAATAAAAAYMDVRAIGFHPSAAAFPDIRNALRSYAYSPQLASAPPADDPSTSAARGGGGASSSSHPHAPPPPPTSFSLAAAARTPPAAPGLLSRTGDAAGNTFTTATCSLSLAQFDAAAAAHRQPPSRRSSFPSSLHSAPTAASPPPPLPPLPGASTFSAGGGGGVSDLSLIMQPHAPDRPWTPQKLDAAAAAALSRASPMRRRGWRVPFAALVCVYLGVSTAAVGLVGWRFTMVNSRRAVQSVATEIQARVASEAVAAVRDAVNVVVQVVAYQREMFATGKWSMSVDREASTMKGMLRVLQSFQTWTTSVYAYTYPDGALNGWTYPIGTADNDDRTLRKWVQTGSLFQVFTCRDDGSVVNLDVSRMVPSNLTYVHPAENSIISLGPNSTKGYQIDFSNASFYTVGPAYEWQEAVFKSTLAVAVNTITNETTVVGADFTTHFLAARLLSISQSIPFFIYLAALEFQTGRILATTGPQQTSPLVLGDPGDPFLDDFAALLVERGFAKGPSSSTGSLTGSEQDEAQALDALEEYLQTLPQLAPSCSTASFSRTVLGADYILRIDISKLTPYLDLYPDPATRSSRSTSSPPPTNSSTVVVIVNYLRIAEPLRQLTAASDATRSAVIALILATAVLAAAGALAVARNVRNVARQINLLKEMRFQQVLDDGERMFPSHNAADVPDAPTAAPHFPATAAADPAPQSSPPRPITNPYPPSWPPLSADSPPAPPPPPPSTAGGYAPSSSGATTAFLLSAAGSSNRSPVLRRSAAAAASSASASSPPPPLSPHPTTSRGHHGLLRTSAPLVVAELWDLNASFHAMARTFADQVRTSRRRLRAAMAAAGGGQVSLLSMSGSVRTGGGGGAREFDGGGVTGVGWRDSGGWGEGGGVSDGAGGTAAGRAAAARGMMSRL